MSTLTADPPTTSHAATPPAAAQVQPTFAGVVRGEWIKLLSLRSTWWALASTAAVITLVALAAAASLNAMADDPALAPGIEQMHGAEVISSGFHFGMLTIAVLGALLITGEYATGLILRVEDRAWGSWNRALASQRHARAAALLRLGAAGCRREHKGALGVPGAQRPRLHLCGPTPTCCRPASNEQGRPSTAPSREVQQRPTACPRPRSATDRHSCWSGARDT
jgi:hypothetical protein